MQTRLQAGQGYKNMFHCILTIYRKETVNTKVQKKKKNHVVKMKIIFSGVDVKVTFFLMQEST